MISNPKLLQATKLLVSGRKLALISNHVSNNCTRGPVSLSITYRHSYHQQQIRNLNSSNLSSQHASVSSDRGSQKREHVFSNDYKPVPEPYVDPVLSYTYGRSNQELRYNTVGKQLIDLANREPHSTAVVLYEEGINKNYEQYLADIDRVMKGIVEKLNVKKGDSIGLYSYNNYQWLLIQFACVRLGLILHPLNPSYKAPELSYVLGKSNVKVLFMPGMNSCQASMNNHWEIVQDPLIKDLQDKKILTNLTDIVVLDGETTGNDFALDGITQHKWSAIYNNDGNLNSNPTLKEMVEDVTPDDVYGIYYTSGTTGFPKGAMVSQFTVMNNINLAYPKLFERGPNNKIRPNVCLPLPLFHQFAAVVGILTPIAKCGSLVLTGMKYNIELLAKTIQKFQCNVIYLTPTILIDMLNHIEAKNPTNFPIRTVLVAGSTVTAELVHRAHKVIPGLEDISIAYGSSENGCLVTCQTMNEPRDTRAYTVGPAIDFTEIKITDPTTGETTPLGQSGEVRTRGFNTMIGYYKDPERTNDVITSNRWYKTGDVGILDTNGRLQIVGRIKDMIIKGGENVYPAEVEHVLHQHSDIEDAHVCGVPDKRYVEEVCAWVKLRDTSKETDETKKSIRDFCKNRLTYFKVPKYIMFVQEYPMTPVKKVKKFEMRAQSIKLLNIKE